MNGTGLVEGFMNLFAASTWIVVAAVFAGISGAASVMGAVVKSREDARQAREQVRLIHGGTDTFCQLIVYFDPEDGMWKISTYHHGNGGPVYDVQVLIREVREDGKPVGNFRLKHIGTQTSTTWPVHVYDIGRPHIVAKQSKRYFAAQITQRNGTSQQDIVIHPKPNGGVQVAFLRLTYNGKDVDPDFSYIPRIRWTTESPEEIARIMKLRDDREQRDRRAWLEREERGLIR